MPGICCLPRDTHQGMRGAVKRPLEWRCADEWRSRRLMDRFSDPQLAERRGHQGRRRGRKLACRGAAMAASQIQLQRARLRRPVPLFDCPRRLAFREPAAVDACCCARPFFERFRMRCDEHRIRV